MQKKKNFWQNLLRSEMPMCSKFNKVVLSLYKVVFSLVLVFLLVTIVIYGYLWYYAVDIQEQLALYETENIVNANSDFANYKLQAMITEIGDDFLIVQPKGVQALMRIDLSPQVELLKLVYSPAVVENGESWLETDIYKIDIQFEQLQLGDIISLENYENSSEGYKAQTILLIDYDELEIPRLEK